MILPKFGGVDQFRLEEIERPSPGTGEILIRIAGTSVHPVDAKARAGEVPHMFPAERLPLLLGFDAAARWKRRARVSRIGSPEMLRPNPLLADAGAVPLAAMIGLACLMTQGEVRRGQHVLIQGGSGGVGHFAVQFAHRLGTTVYATASGRNRDFLRELGTEIAIDYNTDQLQDLAGQMDLVFDLAGNKTEEKSWAALKLEGMLVLAAGQPNLALAHSPGQRARFALAQSTREDLERVARMLDDEQVRLTISGRFPLDASVRRKLSWSMVVLKANC